MYRTLIFLILLACLSILILPTLAQDEPPTLTDFWEGRAEWQIDIPDVGLPVGESDTIQMSQSEYWSYLHASNQSASVIDQCGMPVDFPGCLTLWKSEDGGESFNLDIPVCLISCMSCPCDDQRDQITSQQYPRIARADDGIWYMVYEWHAQTMIRRSEDGLNWSDWNYLVTPGGTWPSSVFPCTATEAIGAHPNIRGQADDCILGGPPGLYIEGDTLYVFVMAGSDPAHMRCYKGDRHGDLSKLQICDTDPLFTAAESYGDVNAFGKDAAANFDFRYISSADILHDGDYYYMAYEGIRGPTVLEFGRDNQFGLGFARAQSLDSQWDKYSGNPIIMGLVDNWGIGHADLIMINGITYLYSATSQDTRGRYVLAWN